MNEFIYNKHLNNCQSECTIHVILTRELIRHQHQYMINNYKKRNTVNEKIEPNFLHCNDNVFFLFNVNYEKRNTVNYLYNLHVQLIKIYLQSTGHDIKKLTP